MTDTDTADTPEAAEQIQAVTIDAPMTIEEAQKQVEARQAKNRGETPEAEVTEPKAEVEEEVEEVEEIAEEEESEADKGVLSKFDLESLDDDQRAELAIELGSGAGKAIGKQRKEIRELKAKLESAEKAKEAAIQLAPSADLPFPELRTVKAVETKIEQIDEMLTEWGDRMTFEQTEKYDEASGQDVKGVEKDGQFYPLKQLKEWRDNHRKALKGLRSQKASVRKLEKLFDDEDVKIETNKATLGIVEGSKASEKYESYLSDPQFEILKFQQPELAAKLIDVYAHAALQESGDSKNKPAKRTAPKSKNSNSIPKGGIGRPSNQAQISVLHKTAHDGNLDIAVRRKAAADLRKLKSQLR